MSTRQITRLRALVLLNREGEQIPGTDGETWDKETLVRLVGESATLTEHDSGDIHELWILRGDTEFKATLTPGTGDEMRLG